MLTHSRQTSEAIYEKLCSVTPAGVNSPVRANRGLLNPPMVAASGRGDQVTDVDGNTYIDMCMSWGPLILGHADPALLSAVQQRMVRGTSFGITTEVEAELATEVCKLVPSMELVRFVSSGTEATMSALRLARGATGRDTVVKFTGHYHGHADFLLVKAGSGVIDVGHNASSAGVPEAAVQDTVCLPFNDPEAFSTYMNAHGDSVAAVILEPVACNMGTVPGERRYMQLIRDLCTQHGALLIYDEVITGFRLGLDGGQGYYGIEADLTCLGKIIGGGFPVGAFGGRREVMENLAPLGAVYQAGTLSGNPVAMEAGLHQLRRLQIDGFYEELERKARFIADPIATEIEALGLEACVQRAGAIFCVYFGAKAFHRMEDKEQLDLDLFARFFRHMFDHGIYLPPAQFECWCMSAAHTDEHLEYVRDTALAFLRSL